MEEGMPSSEMVIPFARAAVDKFCDSAGGVRSAEWSRCSRRITIGRNRPIFRFFHLLIRSLLLS